jgi:hypothetical protein
VPQRLRRRLGERRVGRRRLRRIRRILTQPAAQFRDLSPKTSHYRLQVLDRLPQRGVLGRELLIGRTPIIRHHTMIRIPPRRSTRHAHQASEDPQITPVTRSPRGPDQLPLERVGTRLKTWTATTRVACRQCALRRRRDLIRE